MQNVVLVIIFLSFFSFSGKAAETTEGNHIPEFYVGVSVGLDHLTTKRTEQLTTGLKRVLFFSSNKSQSTNGINAKGLFGFLWTFPKTSFVLSPEIYLGKGGVEAALQGSKHDPDIPADKNLQSTIKRSFSMGIVLRAGFYLTDCNNNFLYGLIGMDKSKFQNKSIFSSTDVGGIVPVLFEKRSKFLKGIVVGTGFERKFNSFKVGIDMRYTSYPSWSYSSHNSASGDTLAVRLKPKIFSTSLTFCYIF